MFPSELSAIDLRIESGRPATVALRLSCGLELSGIRVWRTPGGPRVVFPTVAQPSPRPVFRLSRARRREWELAILEIWRSRALESVGRPARLRRAA